MKRKPGKAGRPRTVNRLPGGSQDVLRSPAADARCQVGVQAPAAPDCHLMSAPFNVLYWAFHQTEKPPLLPRGFGRGLFYVPGAKDPGYCQENVLVCFTPPRI